MAMSPILFLETSNKGEIHAPAFTAQPFEPPDLTLNPWVVAGLCILALLAAGMTGMLLTLWWMLP